MFGYQKKYANLCTTFYKFPEDFLDLLQLEQLSYPLAHD
jgi:hypothetical protein